MDPVTLGLIITGLTSVLLGLIDAIFGSGGGEGFMKTVRAFLDNLGNFANDVWASGKTDVDDDDNDNGKPSKPLCYIAHKTYENRDFDKLYIVKNSLPSCVIKGYYKVGSQICKCRYIPRLTFLPFLEAIKGVMQ